MKAPDPAKFPWVVRVYQQSNASGCYGWVGRAIGSYDDAAEARAVLDAPLGRGEISRELLKWEKRGGRWDLVRVSVHRRKRKT